MRRRRRGLLLAAVSFVSAGGEVRPASAAAFVSTMPLTGCTFYKPRVARHFAKCAEFSAVRGRRGCRKVKGACPLCVTYPGDDVEMWLPDFFIEITRHAGRSMFAEGIDGKALAAHLSVGVKWWEISTKAPLLKLASHGASSTSGTASFWHARILTVPYGAIVTSFPPLHASVGTGLPVCFSAASEYLPAQWNYNLADAPFALAWAPLGAPMCLSILGGTAVAGVDEVKRKVAGVSSAMPKLPSMPAPQSCATPVGAQEALAKNALPSSDALAPISDLSRLCMRSWGNLVPRTGWIASDDPFMSALIAAYKFQSLAGDMHLASSLEMRTDDKWQIVYPPRIGGGCFTPGTLTGAAALGGDDPLERAQAEAEVGGVKKDHTYVIAVWRRRNSCEEPLETVGGWTASYRANFAKNQALCQTVSGF